MERIFKRSVTLLGVFDGIICGTHIVQVKMLKAHNAVNREQGYASLSYLIVDTDTQQIISGGEYGVDKTARSTGYYRTEAMATALEHATLHADPNETISVFNHKIPHAETDVMSVVEPEVSTLIQSKELTVDFTSEHDSLHTVTHGMMCMSRDYNKPFSTQISDTEYEIQTPVELYTDGSHKDAANRTALGYAFIDDAGTLVGLGAQSIAPLHSSLEAEYQAVYAGVMQALEQPELSHLVLHVDNKRVADVLKGYRPPLERNKDTADELFALMENFEQFDVKETNRTENRLADSLANYGHEQNINGMFG